MPSIKFLPLNALKLLVLRMAFQALQYILRDQPNQIVAHKVKDPNRVIGKLGVICQVKRLICSDTELLMKSSTVKGDAIPIVV